MLPQTEGLGSGIPTAITQPPEPEDLTGDLFERRYQILERIGKGGTAEVYRAHHRTLRRDVAIKVLLPELSMSKQISARFEREAYSASRLKHPNCIQVTDFGETVEGRKYMVMELLEGHELNKLIRKPLDPERAVSMMIQIFRGLQHAHEAGVIHRDLKPQNVIVTIDHEGREVLKIVDFGLAKVTSGDTVDPAYTQAGMVFGTPMYMSPEQAVGMADVDHRADLYSAGVILYEMLAGHPPFTAEEPLALLQKHVTVAPPPLPRSVPRRLRKAVEGLLAKHRDDRFSSAKQMLDFLRPRPGEKPPSAPKPRKPTEPRIDANAVKLAQALERASIAPIAVNLEGDITATPVPLPVPQGSTPMVPRSSRSQPGVDYSAMPSLELADVRRESPGPRAKQVGIFPGMALMLVLAAVAVGWVQMRGAPQDLALSAGGVAFQAFDVVFAVGALFVLIGIARWWRRFGTYR